jgi:hypothetical protein
MKHGIIAFFALVLAFAGTAYAQVPEQTFKAGSYRGVMTVTTSVDNVGQTTSTLKLSGRSDGNSRLRMIATPQLAAHLIDGDDYPAKLFSLYYENFFQSMVIEETLNLDTEGGEGSFIPLTSMTVKGDRILATLIRPRAFGINLTLNTTIKIVLTRTGK